MRQYGIWFGLLAALAWAGCGGDGGGGGGGGGGDAGTSDSGGGDGGDYLYVISELKVPDVASECIGLDLDGQPGGTCNGQQDCGADIDNNFAALLNAAAGFGGGGTDIGASIQDNINQGKLVLLVRLRNVDSFTDDSDLRVDVLLGMLPEGTSAPTLNDMRLAPGQTFDIDGRSLSGGEPMASVPARITGGKLESDPVDLPLSFSAGGEALTLVLKGTRFVADTISADSISMGVLGGSISVSAVVDLICKLSPENAGTAVPLLQSFADIESTPGSGDCDVISAGLGFAAVSAMEGATRTPAADPDDGGMGGMDPGMLPPECTMGMDG